MLFKNLKKSRGIAKKITILGVTYKIERLKALKT